MIFTVDAWIPEGTVPESLWQVARRQKEILYASRPSSHPARQKQIHHSRHVIRELSKAMHEAVRASDGVKELAPWGCHTTMHVIRLAVNGIDGEDHLKDIDFTPSGIWARRQAGYDHAQPILEASPWDRPVNPFEGIVIHDSLEDVSAPIAVGIDGFAGRTK